MTHLGNYFMIYLILAHSISHVHESVNIEYMILYFHYLNFTPDLLFKVRYNLNDE